RVGRIRHDDLVATGLDRLGDPFTVRPAFDQDPRARPPAKHVLELLDRRSHPPVEQHGPLLIHEPNERVTNVQINGTIVHGWLLLCALSALTSGLYESFVNGTMAHVAIDRYSI